MSIGAHSVSGFLANKIPRSHRYPREVLENASLNELEGYYYANDIYSLTDIYQSVSHCNFATAQGYD